MPKSTETRKAARKREAVRSVVLFAVLQIVCAGALAALRHIPGLPRWAAVPCAVLAAASLASIAGALVVLRQRFREIEGGEEDAAGQY